MADYQRVRYTLQKGIRLFTVRCTAEYIGIAELREKLGSQSGWAAKLNGCGGAQGPFVSTWPLAPKSKNL